MSPVRTFLLSLVDNWPIKILSIAAAVMLFMLYRINTLEERFFTLPVEIQVSDNFLSINPSVERVRVRVRGNQEEIFAILEEDVEAFIDLSSKSNEGEYEAPILIKKKGTALDVRNIEIIVEPINGRTHLERKLSRSVVVQPRLDGFPQAGYTMDQYFITPSAVTVTGPRSQVERLQFIPTEDIDLTGRFEDFSVRSRLVAPSENLSFLGGDVIEFSGIISEEIVIRSLGDIDIIGIDLAPDLLINGMIPRGSIKLQGTQQRMEKLRLQNLQFTVDFSSIKVPGTYTLPLIVEIPDELAVLSFSPRTVTIEAIALTRVEQ